MYILSPGYNFLFAFDPCHEAPALKDTVNVVQKSNMNNEAERVTASNSLGEHGTFY
jgi:hypothetical protein